MFRDWLRVWAVGVLSRYIAQSGTSKKRGTAARMVRESLLRVRAVLLTCNRLHSPSRGWSATRRTVMLLDPVAAGLWPLLRRRKGLNLPQRLARSIVARSNLSELEAIREEDLQRFRRVLHGLSRRFARQIAVAPQQMPTPAAANPHCQSS